MSVVYHYTSLSAMMNILRTQKIWATEIDYLNDVTERKLLINIVDGQIGDFAASHHLDGTPLGLSSSRDVGDGPFVASFSADGDSLNQWRSYCPVANGVSIGFKVKCLQKARLMWKPPYEGAKRGLIDFDSNCHFKAVTYIEPSDADTGRRVLNAAHVDAVKTVEQMEEYYPEQSFSVDDYFRKNLETEASFYKHKAFSNETEYRLVLSSVFFQSHQVEFRCTRSSLVPYISLSVPSSPSAELMRPALGEFPESYRWDAVAEIVIGPTPNTDLTSKAVWTFCKSIGLASAQIRTSGLPYRDW